MGNRLIMATIVASQSLGSPTYFTLAHLSFIDTIHSITMVPKKIVDLLFEKKIITFGA